MVSKLLNLIAVSAMLSTTLAFAEPNPANPEVTQNPVSAKPATPITPVVGLDPLRGAFGAQPGTYNFMSYDGTFIQGKVLDRIFATRDTDRKYYMDAVQKLNTGLERLLRYTLYYDPEGLEGSKGYPYEANEKLPGLFTLSERAKATSGKYLTADEFLTAVRRFTQERDLLTAQIESLRGIKTAFPSQQEVKLEKDEVKIPSYGDLNMDEVADLFLKRIATVTEAAQKMRHKIRLPNGNVHFSKEGEGLVLTDMAFFNPDELKEARALRTKLLTEQASERDALTKYTLYSKKSIQDFIVRFWDRYRLQQLDVKNERQSQVDFLMRLFWTRSYLRAQYGTRLGGIGIDYIERAFNLDVILASNKSLMNFKKEVLWSDADVMTSIKNYRNIIYRLQERTGNALPAIDNPAGIVDKGVNAAFYFGGNAAYVITFLAGNPNLAQAMNMVMRLCASDLYEEYALSDATIGQNKIIELYKQRFKNTPESKKQVEEWEDSFDANMDESLSITAGSQQQAIRFAVDVLKNKTDRWQQAQDQLALLKSFEESNQFVNKVLKERKSRLRD